ncbi:M56 family metallopeptidase [Hymenobacter pini]|uniref:M56 family metallopeptidase n=1 Tax=Hymenobacter pini TaxID=2880879 RepID=UPI001CF40B56|nr:M56 family metallopeptidase [Hymenobacter pini]MCA8831379.1 M48 family metalloprotease [Hymenobacter pini]
MNWLETFLPPALVRALGWTLVHSLWQGAVVALALAGLLLLLRQHSAEVRYRTSAAALLVLLTLASITFARYYTAAPPAASSATAGFTVGNDAAVRADGSTPTTATVATATVQAAPVAVEPAAPTGLQAWLTYFDNNLPVLVAAWLLGLLAMTLRLLGGLAYVQRLRRYRVQPLAEEWQQRLQALADKANLKQPVQLLESALVRVPVVVGHLSPVILLPLGTVSGLSAAYLEAILAHELAHVQRRDYLMNLVQSVAETLFFYHPAVWFITACLRTERENCCDDAATALVGGNALTVARALAALAELTAAPEPAETRLAMSALGPDGSVLGRIRRLVQGRTAPTFTEGFMAACVVLSGLVLLTSAVAMADPRPANSSSLGSTLKQLPFLNTEPDTTQKKSVSLAPGAPATLPPVAGEDDLAALNAPVATSPEAAPATSFNHTFSSNEATDAAGGDDDEGKKRKRARQQVVVMQGPGRSRPGTVVIEKDKKGRITSLTVDGQPVETASTGKQKSKKAASQVEVIQLPAGRQAWASGRSFNYNFDDKFAQGFRFQGPGLSAADVARIKADAQRATADARRQLRENPQWRVEMNRGADVWMDQAAKGRLQGLKNRLQALQGAENSLRSTLTDEDLNEEQRAQIEEQLENIREQQQDARDDFREDLRDRMEDAEDRSRNGGNDDATRRRLEAEMRRHEAEMRRLEADMRRHESDMRRNEADLRRSEAELRRSDADLRRREGRDSEEALLRELRKDGLIKSSNNVQMSLSPTSFTVNGKKQSAAMRDKYLKLVEKQTGRKLTKGSFVMNRQTSGSTVDFRGPDAPAAPPTPPAPPAVGAPAPPPPPRVPRAPRAPRFNSDNIRAELRKDGVIGANEKSFQFQLNDEGLIVNGKKQSDALANKYRKLVDESDGNGRNTHRNVQISISE